MGKSSESVNQMIRVSDELICQMTKVSISIVRVSQVSRKNKSVSESIK